jgi:hypothetical protein
MREEATGSLDLDLDLDLTLTLHSPRHGTEEVRSRLRARARGHLVRTTKGCDKIVSPGLRRHSFPLASRGPFG